MCWPLCVVLGVPASGLLLPLSSSTGPPVGPREAPRGLAILGPVSLLGPDNLLRSGHDVPGSGEVLLQLSGIDRIAVVLSEIARTAHPVQLLKGPGARGGTIKLLHDEDQVSMRSLTPNPQTARRQSSSASLAGSIVGQLICAGQVRLADGQPGGPKVPACIIEEPGGGGGIRCYVLEQALATQVLQAGHGFSAKGTGTSAPLLTVIKKPSSGLAHASGERTRALTSRPSRSSAARAAR